MPNVHPRTNPAETVRKRTEVGTVQKSILRSRTVRLLERLFGAPSPYSTPSPCAFPFETTKHALQSQPASVNAQNHKHPPHTQTANPAHPSQHSVLDDASHCLADCLSFLHFSETSQNVDIQDIRTITPPSANTPCWMNPNLRTRISQHCVVSDSHQRTRHQPTLRGECSFGCGHTALCMVPPKKFIKMIYRGEPC